jgi:hypothetical protein
LAPDNEAEDDEIRKATEAAMGAEAAAAAAAAIEPDPTDIWPADPEDRQTVQKWFDNLTMPKHQTGTLAARVQQEAAIRQARNGARGGGASDDDEEMGGVGSSSSGRHPLADDPSKPMTLFLGLGIDARKSPGNIPPSWQHATVIALEQDKVKVHFDLDMDSEQVRKETHRFERVVAGRLERVSLFLCCCALCVLRTAGSLATATRSPLADPRQLPSAPSETQQCILRQRGDSLTRERLTDSFCCVIVRLLVQYNHGLGLY